MKSFNFFNTLFCIFLFVSGCSTAPTRSIDGLTFEMSESGTFSRSIGSKYETAENTAVGYVWRDKSISFKNSTDKIPMKLGVAFGYRFKVKNCLEGEIPGMRMRAIHPPIYASNGEAAIYSEAPIYPFCESGVANDQVLYTLDDPRELISGKWTLEIFIHNKVVLSNVYIVQ